MQGEKRGPCKKRDLLFLFACAPKAYKREREAHWKVEMFCIKAKKYCQNLE